MRVLPAALALSVVGHGAAIAWIATRPHRPPLPRVAPHVGTPPPRVREPIAVTVLGDAVAPSRGRGRIAVAPAMPRVEVAASRARPIDVAVSNTFVEQFLAKPPPAPVPAPEPDAPALLDDQIDDLSAQLHDPSWHGDRRDARHRLNALIEAREHDELQPDGDGYKAEHLAFSGHVDADGAAHLEAKAAGLDDALMRAHGIDPYAANKLAFLDRTRDERYAIGTRYKRKLLARSGQLALDALHAIWNETADVAERKQLVFELWDACAESGGADLVAGARDARAQILEFVQAHLTGPDAYTADELAALNARRVSTATFAP